MGVKSTEMGRIWHSFLKRVSEKMLKGFDVVDVLLIEL